MLLSGTLADLDVAGIAAMTSLGRTRLRLELRRATGDLIGSMVLKAGRVVSATAGGVRGRDALRVILRAASDTRFQLAHEPLDFVLSSALASVDELWQLARRATGSTARIAMMQGPLDELDLVTLLQTIGMGRQLVEVEVRDRAGAALGAVRVKSGKLVAAHAGQATGVDAVAALRGAADGLEFAAYRVAADPAPLRALASVAELGTRPSRADHGVADRGETDRVVMEGSLADFDLPTLLHTIGCSRQYCALEIGDERARCGTIGIKAGVVVSANAGALTGIPAVQQLIAAPRSRRFRLIQRATELPDQVPLGPVGQVLLHADAPAPAVRPAPRPPTRPPSPRPPSSDAAVPAPDDRASAAHTEALVMEGRLADFDVRTVLEVLAATRQHARLEIFAPGQPPLGEVVLKAGWILSCQAGARRGTEALARLLAASPRLAFRVLTAAGPVAGPALGQVHDVLVGLPGRRAPDRAASTRVLRWAIPISFALGGTIVFLVTRGGTTTRPVALRDPPVHPAPPAVVAAAKPAEPGPTAAPPVPAPDASLPADRAGRSIATAQIALKQLGFEPGPVDGVLGRRTQSAILRFQRAQHLRASGALDPATWSAIAAQLMARRARP